MIVMTSCVYHINSSHSINVHRFLYKRENPSHTTVQSLLYSVLFLITVQSLLYTITVQSLYNHQKTSCFTSSAVTCERSPGNSTCTTHPPHHTLRPFHRNLVKFHFFSAKFVYFFKMLRLRCDIPPGSSSTHTF